MLPSMALQPLTHDLSDYALAGVLPGGLALAAVRGESAQGLWIADVPSAGRPRQVAADSGSLHELEGITWSPDGQIVYTAMDSGNVDIYTVDPRTGERRRLTSDPAADFHPDVSADGTMVAFASERGGAPGVWVMSIDGTQPRRLTTGRTRGRRFLPTAAGWSCSGIDRTICRRPCGVCRLRRARRCG